MMADPHVSVQVFKLVVMDQVVAVTDHFEHEHVLAMRENKCPLFTSGGVESAIQAIAILIDDLVPDALC